MNAWPSRLAPLSAGPGAPVCVPDVATATTRRARRRAALLLVSLVLAGCGSEGAPGDAGSDTTVTALAASVEAGVAPDVEPVSEPRAVSSGDTVQTDPSGLGEIRFADGSLVRVARSEGLVLTELSAASVQRTRQRLTVGSTWHEVKKLTAQGSAYEVTTPVGVAAVRGTVFSLVCDAAPSCVLIVLEGTVELQPLTGPAVQVNAFERVELAAGGVQDEPEPVSADALREDAWVSANIQRGGLEDLYDQAPEVPQASTYSGTITRVPGTPNPSDAAQIRVECEPECVLTGIILRDEDPQPTIVLEPQGGGRYTFTSPAAGDVCAVPPAPNVYIRPFSLEVVFTGDTMTLTATYSEARATCPDGTRAVVPGSTTTFTGTLTEGEPVK